MLYPRARGGIFGARDDHASIIFRVLSQLVKASDGANRLSVLTDQPCNLVWQEIEGRGACRLTIGGKIVKIGIARVERVEGDGIFANFRQPHHCKSVRAWVGPNTTTLADRITLEAMQ